MKEEGTAETKVEVEPEDEKESDTLDTSEETNAEQKLDESDAGEEKPGEKADGDREEEKPSAVAIEMVENVPLENEGKTETVGGQEGEAKNLNTEGGEGVLPVTVETTVTNETETGLDHSKYEELDDELPWAMYRSLDIPPQKPPVEEDDDWPASDDEGDYGNIFIFIYNFSQ